MARDPYRRQMRRMRRAWRKGEYAPPILLLGTGQPWVFYALAAATRWCYRHRSAFYPFEIAAAEFIVAATSHGHHARYRIPDTGHGVNRHGNRRGVVPAFGIAPASRRPPYCRCPFPGME
jgi:hypothetical protein